jgi:hypothetical protein
MKKYIYLISIATFVLFSNATQAQIKIHDDNHVSLTSLTKGGGVQIYPNGYTVFQPAVYTSYGWMNLVYAPLSTSKCWIVRDNAGNHTFHVRGNGDVVCNVLYELSDESVKTNVSNITSASEKIMNLQGVYFDFINETKQDTLVFSDKYGNTYTYITNTDNLEDLLNNEDIDSDAVNAVISERNRHHMGLIAQEVEQVVPEVVRTQTDGKKAVAYSSLVPLLIEAFKEQQIRINELEQYIQNCCEFNDNIKSKSTEMQNSETTNNTSVLFQNTPNPFNQSTIINYEIGEKSISEAQIFVFDLNGKLLKTYPLTTSKGNIQINANELEPGMYLYSLVVNKKEIDTKRMILTQ